MDLLVTYWDAWLRSLFCLILTASAVLRFNHLERGGFWIEKSICALVALGAFGVAISPPFGYLLDPSTCDVLLNVGVAIYSVWLTAEDWEKLVFCSLNPGFPHVDRRYRR